MKACETALGENEATRIVRERDHSQEANHEGERRDAERQRGATNRCGRHTGGKQQPAAAAKGTELRHEAKPAIGVANDHARDERQPDADVVAVVHNHVVEALQLVAEQVEIGVERLHGCLYPPLTAAITRMVAPSRAGVLKPSRNLMFSPSRKTFT